MGGADRWGKVTCPQTWLCLFLCIALTFGGNSIEYEPDQHTGKSGVYMDKRGDKQTALFPFEMMAGLTETNEESETRFSSSSGTFFGITIL